MLAASLLTSLWSGRLQQARQIPPGMTRRHRRDVFRRADADHRAAASPALWVHVDQPVGGFDDVEVVAGIPRQ